MKSRILLLLTACLLLFVVAVDINLAQTEEGPIVQAIRERGTVNCGINGSLPGFSIRFDEFSPYAGFDVDICRAIATAVLGDPDAVEYIELAADDRLQCIASKRCDVISRNTTWTLTRDNTWSATFGPVVFYDGQGVMVKNATGITSSTDLAGASICVTRGTTSATNIIEWGNSTGTDFELVEVDGTTQEVAAAFFDGDCDAITSDRSQLAALRADRLATASEDATLYSIINFTLSKEPLAPLSPQSDEQFAQIIRWTIYGLIQAEESGVTSDNVDELAANSRDATIQNLLGSSDANLGEIIGVDNDFMVNVIREVGNYGEIYERHFGANTLFAIPRGENNLWKNGGLLYAPPFR